MAAQRFEQGSGMARHGQRGQPVTDDDGQFVSTNRCISSQRLPARLIEATPPVRAAQVGGSIRRRAMRQLRRVTEGDEFIRQRRNIQRQVDRIPGLRMRQREFQDFARRQADACPPQCDTRRREAA